MDPSSLIAACSCTRKDKSRGEPPSGRQCPEILQDTKGKEFQLDDSSNRTNGIMS